MVALVLAAVVADPQAASHIGSAVTAAMMPPIPDPPIPAPPLPAPSTPSPPAAPQPADSGLTTGILPLDLASSALQFLQHPEGWFLGRLMAASPGAFLTDYFKHLFTNPFSLGSGCQDSFGSWTTGDCTAFGLWKLIAPVGILFALLALMARAVHRLFDQNVRSIVLIAETMFRLPIAIGTILVSYTVIAWLSSVSWGLGWGIFTSFVLYAGKNSVTAWDLTLILPPFSAANMALATLDVLLFILMALWLLVVVVASQVLQLFAAIAAPVMIAFGVFDTKNPTFQWWLQMLIGTIMAPVLLGLGVGITVALAMFMYGSAFGALGAIIVTVGGFAFISKLLREGTVRVFTSSHTASALLASMMGIAGLALVPFEVGARVRRLQAGARTAATQMVGAAGAARTNGTTAPASASAALRGGPPRDLRQVPDEMRDLFRERLAAAIENNPRAHDLIRSHPDVQDAIRRQALTGLVTPNTVRTAVVDHVVSDLGRPEYRSFTDHAWREAVALWGAQPPQSDVAGPHAAGIGQVTARAS